MSCLYLYSRWRCVCASLQRHDSYTYLTYGCARRQGESRVLSHIFVAYKQNEEAPAAETGRSNVFIILFTYYCDSSLKSFDKRDIVTLSLLICIFYLAHFLFLVYYSKGKIWRASKFIFFSFFLLSCGGEEEEEEALPLAAHYRTSKLQASVSFLSLSPSLSPFLFSNYTCVCVMCLAPI